MNLEEIIKQEYDKSEDKYEFMNHMKEMLFKISPENCNPVDRVLWVPMENVVANNYNPNSVAAKEMQLLYTSVREDGYTQPIVTIWDDKMQKYVIVDGFHRNLISRKYADIAERCGGRLPIVVIDKNIDDRMASTVRHNRARGSHSVDGMVNIVFNMMRDGVPEKTICEKLGMEQREFAKLKYVTGFAKIFKDYSYSKAVAKVVDHKRVARESATQKTEQE